MADALRPIEQPPLLSQFAQERIKEYILANQLRAGMELPPETELARRLGISRNSVREAVKALSALGIVEVRRGSGLSVGSFPLEPLLANLGYGVRFALSELSDLLQIRRTLEGGLVGAAITALDDARRARLRALIAEMQARAEAGNLSSETDRAFHAALFEGVGNTTLLRLLDIFWLAYHDAAAHMALGAADPIITYRNHAAILDAVLAGDVTGAQVALEGHYEDIADRVRRAAQS